MMRHPHRPAWGPHEEMSVTTPNGLATMRMLRGPAMGHTYRAALSKQTLRWTRTTTATRSGASAPTPAPKPKSAFVSTYSPHGPTCMHTGMPPTQTTIGNPARTSHKMCPCPRSYLMGQERCGGSGCANTPTRSLRLALTWTSGPMCLRPPPRHHRRHRCQRQLHRQLRPQAPVGRFGINAAGLAGQGQLAATRGVSASQPTLTTTSASQAQTRLRRRRQRQHLHLHLHRQARHRPQHRAGHARAATARVGVGVSVSLSMEQASATKTLGGTILTFQLGAAVDQQVDGAAPGPARQGSISFRRMKVGRSPLTESTRRESARTVRSHTSSSATASHTAPAGRTMTL
mmetsp:Transcript_112830/g.319597  ORF Transcript_112830/g.319597 Transcript_112830/m.319597 type:complete len:345 (-) Transcript_112830:1139-2173(-)